MRYCLNKLTIDKNKRRRYIKYENGYRFQKQTAPKKRRFRVLKGNRMASRSKYSTKQGEIILSCLMELQTQHVTVDRIMDFLREKGETVGQTTVYRNLDKLVKEGTVVKYAGAEGMGACYQYIAHSQSCGTHYHMICADCGQVIHLQCDYLDAMTTHLLDHHGFCMDKFKTVIYGVCKKCAAKKAAPEETAERTKCTMTEEK